jgi:hypothetical protein
LDKPYSIGIFDSQVFFSSATFMGTDWEDNIYIMDPLTSESCVLKRFDKNGQFREAWDSIDAQRGKSVAVTKDGYIWAGLGRLDPEDYAGFPIVVYRKGKKGPALDWCHKLPKELDDRIRTALKERGLEWEKGKGWMVYGLEAGPREVSLRLGGEVVGQEGQIARVLWLLMRSDGSQVLDVKIGKGDIPHLAPDGRLWIRESNFNVERWTWSKVWYWERGKKRAEPLIDRIANKEPWADKITLGKAIPPQVKIDTKGYIYLFWEREYPEPRFQQFQIEGKKIDDFPLNSEQALTVLDSQRRLVTYLPWMPCSLESYDRWIKPLPDGSGFYRIQFFEKEAQIFFHPLPQ